MCVASSPYTPPPPGGRAGAKQTGWFKRQHSTGAATGRRARHLWWCLSLLHRDASWSHPGQGVVGARLTNTSIARYCATKVDCSAGSWYKLQSAGSWYKLIPSLRTPHGEQARSSAGQALPRRSAVRTSHPVCEEGISVAPMRSGGELTASREGSK